MTYKLDELKQNVHRTIVNNLAFFYGLVWLPVQYFISTKVCMVIKHPIFSLSVFAKFTSYFSCFFVCS